MICAVTLATPVSSASRRRRSSSATVIPPAANIGSRTTPRPVDTASISPGYPHPGPDQPSHQDGEHPVESAWAGHDASTRAKPHHIAEDRGCNLAAVRHRAAFPPSGQPPRGFGKRAFQRMHRHPQDDKYSSRLYSVQHIPTMMSVGLSSSYSEPSQRATPRRDGGGSGGAHGDQFNRVGADDERGWRLAEVLSRWIGVRRSCHGTPGEKISRKRPCHPLVDIGVGELLQLRSAPLGEGHAG